MKKENFPRVVLDSFALIAYLQGETGKSQVESWLRQSERGSVELYLSLINLGEVAYILERDVGLEKTRETLGALDELPITIVDVNRQRVLAAAHIKAQYSVAYADAFAVALAQELDAPLVSRDPELSAVESVITVDWIAR